MTWTKLTRLSGLIEWVCEHGVGHPDANSIEDMEKYCGKGSSGTWGIHGCDGCCQRNDFPGRKK